MQLLVHPFFDPETHSFTYVLVDSSSGCCAIIDPVLNYDAVTQSARTTLADALLEFVSANDLVVEWILETHVHADHMSAARYLKRQLVCAQTAIGAGVVQVQTQVAEQFAVAIACDGRQFDRLLADGERICVGRVCGRVLHTPGHTPACCTFVFDDKAFVGDTLFMPDFGTARCDFPNGCPQLLRRSIDKIFALPGATKLFMCHDYGPNGRDIRYLTSVAEERRANVHVAQDIPRERFVRQRLQKDRTLRPPALFIPAVTANVQGGIEVDQSGRCGVPIARSA
jgi:glyoxylase-like metal-dependent hydrolase (beta-lactamase superfamily II)